ncbi:50S ribosomal subunit protein L21 [Azospirillaceae bacterium]
MFAVIRTGGKQYKVASGDVIRVERLAAEPGAAIRLDEVLMVAGGEAAPLIGSPTVGGASVSAEVVAQARGPKLIVFKKKRRQNYRRKNGHRQDITILRITGVSCGDVAAS